MKRILIAFLSILLLTVPSCITPERCARHYPPAVTKTDSVSVVVTERIHDTTVVVREDSSWLKAWVECDSNGQATLKELIGYRAGSRTQIPLVNIRGNVLTALCKCDSLTIYHVMKSRDTTRAKVSDTLITPPPVKVEYIPGWMYFFGISGMILWGLGLLYIGYRLLKLKQIIKF